ncbi:unnamed protein product [Periconia digitata]|uniref:DUF221-domain-containing protein n=1 Tax=Periconia digitata TaxID=1303443 RepID=A0A9W4UKD9_9PLEO|nr:unnamed protein product [Periconia digitata]
MYKQLHERGMSLALRAASGSGSHRSSGSSSLSALLSTLVPCFVLAAVLVGLFLFLRAKHRRLYAPRTYHELLDENEKTPPANDSFLGWTGNFRRISDEYILNHHSLDGYLYVRFFKMLVFMSFGGCIITWPVLFPVNATGGGGESGLDILSFSNVNNPTRYFAHALIGWVFFGFVLFLIWRETSYVIKIRQAYLLSTWNTSRISQRTVLFTNVPEQYLSHTRLRELFHGISQMWLVSDMNDLEDDVDDMNDTALKLENGEIELIQKVNKTQQKKREKEGDGSGRRSRRTSGEQLIDQDMRPTHRLKPLIGEKVDTIDYCRKDLANMLNKVQAGQKSHLQGKEKLASALFVEFDTMVDAQNAYALTVDEKPGSFVARQMGILPDEVIWKNLKMNSWDRSLRRGLATAAISAIILFWSIPVALVGIISNVNYLTNNVPFLAWIDDIPKVILGVVTGLLPTILLAALMALVPIICRFFAKLAGAISLSEIELQTQSWYFAFQVIQVFLITTFTSGATAVASQIVSNPTLAVPLLAKNLPKASNFYISYFVLYGVANAAKYLFNIGGLVGVFILSKFAKSPRKKYQRYVQLTSPSWGSEYPKWTNLGVIAISYAIISPLVLGFATVGMGLIYVAYRYNMIYVFATQIDTKGACYARALGQLMVGVYLAELCTLGLFGIGIGNSVSSVGPVVLQIVLIIATVVFHISLKKKLRPLVETLPLNLLRESEHTAHDDKAEKGLNTEQNGMHPRYVEAQRNGNGYSKMNGQESFKQDGLTSARYRDWSATRNTHAARNDIGEDSHTENQSLLKRIFMPQAQSAASLSASLVSRFRHPVPTYTEQEARQAYLHPALTEEPPVIWLPRDSLGISRKEVEELQSDLGEYGVNATDEGAILNGKGKVEWTEDSATEAPLWERKVIY